MARKLLQALSLALLAGLLFANPLLAKDSQSGNLDGYLKAKELSQLVNNTTAEVEFAKKKSKGLIYFSPNGELKLITRDILFKGQWKVRKNDRLCTQIEGSSWDCRILAKTEQGYQQYIVKKSGKHRPELTYRKFHSGDQLTQLQRAPLLPRGTLNARQVKKLFSDQTVESVTAKKGRVSQTYYAPAGTVEQLRSGVKRLGKWRVTGKGRICLQMEDLEEKCRIIVKEAGEYRKYIVKKNGQHQHSVSYRHFTDGKTF